MTGFSCKLNVKRNGLFQNINSSFLIPGDLVEIPEKCALPCDIIILSGTCIVNESMLTGESIPIIKS